MLDRQDIDALLMGALYGELSPDERTRLDEHLSAHPQDRMVLDGLGRARQALRESHILALEIEPPAAVSALLLQEAARRANPPRAEREGFFAKLAAFLRHPAAAAAAVVVLVAGVAGTLYLRGGRTAVQTAEPAAAPAIERPEVPAPPPAPGVAADHLAYAQGSAAAAEDGKNVAPGDPVADDRAGNRTGKPAPEDGYQAGLVDEPPAHKETAKGAVATGKAPGGAKKQRYIEVTTPEPTLKTLDDAEVAVEDRTRQDQDKVGQAMAPGTGATANLDVGGRAPVAGVAGGDETAPTRPATTERPADPAAAAAAAHGRLVALVKSNKCTDAAKVAAQIYASYPDYYAENVANDRRVKACRPYIEAERRKREEAQKSRAKMAEPSSESQSPDAVK